LLTVTMHELRKSGPQADAAPDAISVGDPHAGVDCMRPRVMVCHEWLLDRKRHRL